MMGGEATAPHAGVGRRNGDDRLMTNRYARWDGSQDPFGPDIPIDEAVGRLNEHLLEGWDAEWALRRLLEEGLPGRFGGLEKLKERLEQLRREQERRGRITDPLEQFRERLEEVQRLEREALAGREDDDARFAEMLLDALPDSPTAQVNELRLYEFASARGRAGVLRATRGHPPSGAREPYA